MNHHDDHPTGPKARPEPGDDRRNLKEITSGYRKGTNPNAITPMVDSNAELKRALSSTLGA